MARLALLLFSSSALAHPGHGALELHWHAGDLVWILAGAVAVLGARYVIRRRNRP